MKLHLTYEFDSEEELREHLTVETRAEPAPAPAPAPEPQTSSDNEPTKSDTDADGMAWDESIHSDPPSFTADGRWRAKRGKADEAKQARADFLAKGGDVTPPDTSTMPGAMPGAPAALPADAPEPVSLDRVIEKINGMLTRQVVTADELAPLYAEHSGTSAEASFGVFQTNETARANLYNALCEIEPELP